MNDLKQEVDKLIRTGLTRQQAIRKANRKHGRKVSLAGPMYGVTSVVSGGRCSG